MRFNDTRFGRLLGTLEFGLSAVLKVRSIVLKHGYLLTFTSSFPVHIASNFQKKDARERLSCTQQFLIHVGERYRVRRFCAGLTPDTPPVFEKDVPGIMKLIADCCAPHRVSAGRIDR
jgi:hypothetical protein